MVYNKTYARTYNLSFGKWDGWVLFTMALLYMFFVILHWYGIKNVASKIAKYLSWSCVFFVCYTGYWNDLMNQFWFYWGIVIVCFYLFNQERRFAVLVSSLLSSQTKDNVTHGKYRCTYLSIQPIFFLFSLFPILNP